MGGTINEDLDLVDVGDDDAVCSGGGTNAVCALVVFER